MTTLGYTAGMTPEAARQLAETYMAEDRPWAVVGQLLQDDNDYYVMEELKPGRQWPLGPGAILISKTTGELHTEPWGAVIDRIDTMEVA